MRNVLTAVLLMIALAVVGQAILPLRGQAMLPLHAAAPPNVARTDEIAGPRTDRIACPTTALIIPVAGVRANQLKSTFNEGRVGHLHHAIDILAPRGTPVLAAVDGRVRKLFLSRAGGITIYEFDATSTTSYYYAHLDRYVDGLREGQPLHRGELIGFVGTTGNAPPGTPHLHFAIEKLPPTKEWWKGEAVDPYPILVARGVTALAPR